jgi:Predicted secreted acid phosphatase
MLDNSAYQARLVLDGTSFSDAGWAAWVAERKARPVPGALEFARAAAEKGVSIVYISNRTHEMKDDTLANLRAYGSRSMSPTTTAWATRCRAAPRMAARRAAAASPPPAGTAC